VGGQPTMTVVTRPAGFDSDGDGMPDTWETAHGLNPNLATDRNLTNPVGYTFVEQYINELASIHSGQTSNSNGGNWNTPAIWTSATPTNDDNAYVVGNGAGANGLVAVTQNNAVCFSLHIGGNGSATADKVSVNSGGALTVNDTIYVGDQNNGTLEINSGGTVQAWNVQLGNTVGSTTYTGNLSLNGGTLKTCEVDPGGGTPGNWTSGGSCTWSGGTVQAIGTLNFAVPATIGAGGATIDSNGFTCTVSGLLSGNGGLTKLGTGTLTLTASNTYSGDTKISGGNIALSNANALQNSTLDYNSYGGTLSFGTLTGAALGGLKGSQALSLTNASSAAVQLQVGGNGQSTSYSGALSGAGSLTKAGTGTLTLTASNAFSGAVNFNGGLINAASLNNLGSGSALTFNGGGLQFGGIYDPSTRTMTFQSGGATLDTNGKIIILANPIGNGGAGGLTKAGSGILTLNAANTYTGDTIVSSGTLELTSAGQISAASDISTSATTATFQVDSGTHIVGNISGVGTTVLSAGGNLTASSVVQNTLTLGTGSRLTIAAIPGGLTAESTLKPVPEPSSIILLIATALGMIIYWKRFR
jgi:autotransporter-associated beta strand protein